MRSYIATFHQFVCSYPPVGRLSLCLAVLPPLLSSYPFIAFSFIHTEHSWKQQLCLSPGGGEGREGFRPWGGGRGRGRGRGSGRRVYFVPPRLIFDTPILHTCFHMRASRAGGCNLLTWGRGHQEGVTCSIKERSPGGCNLLYKGEVTRRV